MPPTSEVTVLVPAIDLGAARNADNQRSAHQAISEALDVLRTAVNRVLLRQMRPTPASTSGPLIAVTVDPAAPVDGEIWFFLDGGTPESLSLRIRRAGVTYDVPLFTFP